MSRPERDGPTTGTEDAKPEDSVDPAAPTLDESSSASAEVTLPKRERRDTAVDPNPPDMEEHTSTVDETLDENLGEELDTVVDPSASPDDEASEEVGIEFSYYGRTDVGLVREHNEDNFLVADLSSGERGSEPGRVADKPLGPRGAIFAVCDGMGGAAAGEVASQMAVDTIYEFFESADRAPTDRDHFARRLVAAIEEAGNRIFSAAKMDRSRRGMGTTATVAGLVDKILFVGQVGDSRAYMLRNGELGLITKDQSLVNQLIEAGQLTDEEAEAFEHSNIILQALGTTEEVTVDLTFLELRRGDRLMLCSDGLSGLVHQEMIGDVMENTPDLAECTKKLIEMANSGGGHDNITVICVDFDGDELAAPGDDAQVAYQQYPLMPGDDDDRVSLPPRETSIKEGGPKPGADVKRQDDETTPQVPTARASSDAPVRPFGWGLVALVLALAAVATAVAVTMGGDGAASDAEADEERAQLAAGTPSAAEEADPTPDEPMPVEVRVRTDVDGTLWIDDQDYGAIREGEDVYVELPPGAYKFEARSGESTIASALLTVRPGVPADVMLAMPSGTTDVPEGEGETVVEEPGGETGSTEGTDGPAGALDEGGLDQGAAVAPPERQEPRRRRRPPPTAETGTSTMMRSEPAPPPTGEAPAPDEEAPTMAPSGTGLPDSPFE